ncbi:hypothetical protein SBA3_2260006 [Candidatus Sulfopaludibacter sp. SbA3]|nr:hypothetical protein SBA3_2260006 [Candidatus Sulfopaludibacter sp. SbA3]
MQEALSQWRSKERAGEIASRVGSLSSSYDNWFLVLHPLQRGFQANGPRVLKYRDDLMQAVEQIRGGIRLGAFNEIRLARKTSRSAPMAKSYQSHVRFPAANCRRRSKRFAPRWSDGA